MKFMKMQPFFINVDISASSVAFVGTVCLIAIRRSVSGRTGCRRCRCGELIRPLISVHRLVLLFLMCIASLIYLSTLLLFLSMTLAG